MANVSQMKNVLVNTVIATNAVNVRKQVKVVLNLMNVCISNVKVGNAGSLH